MDKSLKTTKAIVKSILEICKPARNSDSYLYLKVIDYFDREYCTDIRNMTVEDFLTGECNIPIPPFETVRRTRQKVQEEFPHLAACSDVSLLRALNEEAYREFARTGGC